MTPQQIEVCQFLETTIHNILISYNEKHCLDDEILQSLQLSMQQWSDFTNIPCPDFIENVDLPYLMAISEWIGYTKAFLMQQSPLPSFEKSPIHIDKYFKDIIKLIDYKSILGLEKHMAGSFQKISLDNRAKISSYANQYKFWGEIDVTTGLGSMVTERAACLKAHRDDFIWLYNRLCDYRSRFVLVAVLGSWLNYDFGLLEKAKESLFSDYFDLDLPLLGGENIVVADVGAFIGDSARAFLNTYGNCQKIYCYEIDPNNIKQAQSVTKQFPMVELRHRAVSDQTSTIYLNLNSSDSSNSQTAQTGSVPIQAVTLDDDIPEPISFIKMDIEGGEQAALRGCQRHIIEDRSQLAICVYHGNQDIWKIPRMVDKMRKDYQFYLRYNGGNLFPSEIVFFAL